MARSLLLGLFGLIILGIVGCTQSGEEGTVSTSEETKNRPVTERLCSIIMVGNLSMGNFAPPTPTPSAEREQLAVLDDLRDPDALGDAQVDKDLKDLIDDKRSEIIPVSPKLSADSDSSEDGTVAIPMRPKSESIADDPEAIREILSASEDSSLEMKEGSENVPILDFSNPENVQTLIESDQKANPEESESGEVEEITIDLTRPMKHYSDLSDNTDESILQEIDLSGLEGEVLAELQADAAREVEKRQNNKRHASIADQLREDEETSQKTPSVSELEAEYQRQAEAFEELFKQVPKEVKKELHKAHFQNFTVWIARVPSGEYYVVRTLEYTGSECALDYQLLLRSPNYEAWMQEQDHYLRQFSFYDSRDTWLPMREIWHCD